MGTTGIMTMKKIFITICFLILSLGFIDQAPAIMHGDEILRPYGGYCRGPKWGWYGARKHVRTTKEVRSLVTEFLKNTTMTVGEILERKTYFEVQILNEDGSEAVDILIIDKRSCRIRSKY